MSENIQSIANGSFVLGQTSATNFVAGPGIKIDEPSAGTVRIGNDETVLFESTGTAPSAVALSESCKNFDKLSVYWAGWTHTSVHGTLVSEVSTQRDDWFVLCGGWIGGSTRGYTIAEYTIKSDGKGFTFNSLGWTNFDANNWHTTTADNGPRIMKIIGINRISGSNA